MVALPFIIGYCIHIYHVAMPKQTITNKRPFLSLDERLEVPVIMLYTATIAKNPGLHWHLPSNPNPSSSLKVCSLA